MKLLHSLLFDLALCLNVEPTRNIRAGRGSRTDSWDLHDWATGDDYHCKSDLAAYRTLRRLALDRDTDDTLDAILSDLRTTLNLD